MKKTTKPKDKGGRPTKLTMTFLEAADLVINEDINAIILTDEELLLLINEKLEEKEQIGHSTLENWKAGKFGDNELGDKFLGLIKKALTRQKQDLFKQLKGDERAWQKWAWIIERKFDDWNMKHKQEESGEKKIIVETRINGQSADQN